MIVVRDTDIRPSGQNIVYHKVNSIYLVEDREVLNTCLAWVVSRMALLSGL
jgi:hypothetical protein